VAAIAGAPIAHSLSPVIHNAWIEAAGLDAVYIALEPRGLGDLVRAARGGLIRGLNVTAPFKAEALALADRPSERAVRAGSANLLTFELDGTVRADNTDGEGLLAAFAEQAPGFDPAAGPVVILGAGGAASGAVAAFVEAGAPRVRVVNRSPARAQALATAFGPVVEAVSLGEVGDAIADANAVINATPVAPEFSLETAPQTAVIMDMVYRPLATPLLVRARARGLRAVDGLAMLIGQARPSFEAFFGVRPPPNLDVRAKSIAYLESAA